jgi:hypothetical protein
MLRLRLPAAKLRYVNAQVLGDCPEWQAVQNVIAYGVQPIGVDLVLGYGWHRHLDRSVSSALQCSAIITISYLSTLEKFACRWYTDLMADALPLPVRFRSAVISLTVASASYDIWWLYKNQDTRDLDAMNNFPTFFLYDEEAHFRNIIVSLHTLYDTHPRTITIKSLIHELEPGAAKSIWRKYNAVHDTAKKVSHVRHNGIAHRNADESYADTLKKAKLRPNDLKKLISDSLDLLTMIADAIGVRKPVMPPLTDNTARLIKLIKAGQAARS